MGEVSEPTTEPGPLRAGTRVEVRSRFDGHWVRGFELVDAGAEGFSVRRMSDGATLPVRFAEEELRPERHRSGMWWYRGG